MIGITPVAGLVHLYLYLHNISPNLHSCWNKKKKLPQWKYLIKIANEIASLILKNAKYWKVNLLGFYIFFLQTFLLDDKTLYQQVIIRQCIMNFIKNSKLSIGQIRTPRSNGGGVRCHRKESISSWPVTHQTHCGPYTLIR